MDELGPNKKKTQKWNGFDWREFRRIALGKLRTAGHGRSSFEVFTQMPWLLRPGDEMRRGGVNLNGLHVAASGVEGETDETISWIVAHTIAGLCHIQVRKWTTTEVKTVPGKTKTK